LAAVFGRRLGEVEAIEGDLTLLVDQEEAVAVDDLAQLGRLCSAGGETEQRVERIATAAFADLFEDGHEDAVALEAHLINEDLYARFVAQSIRMLEKFGHATNFVIKLCFS